jgi:transcriptional regulator with XRE-family HTH domain
MAEDERQTTQTPKTMISDLDLAEKMTIARLQAGLSQHELADLMQTSRTTVTRWETGERVPTITTLDRLAEVTGLRLEVRLV